MFHNRLISWINMPKVIKICTLLYTFLPFALCLGKNNSLCRPEDPGNQCSYYVRLTNEEIKSKQNEIAELKMELARDQKKMEDEYLASLKLLQEIIHKNSESCADVRDYSGVLQIKPNGSNPFMVSCDSELAGSGWTVIQRRIDGSVNFNRNWTEYKQGFGDVEKEYFIGLERLHQMTKGQRYELYIHLVDQSNEVRYARYDNFVVENEDKKYELSSVGNFSGNSGDSISTHVGLKFSTYDNDNDIFRYNCAKWLKGGWWYFNCGNSNLNGRDFQCALENSNKLETQGCIYWHHWHGRSYSLKHVQMMIRPWQDQY